LHKYIGNDNDDDQRTSKAINAIAQRSLKEYGAKRFSIEVHDRSRSSRSFEAEVNDSRGEYNFDLCIEFQDDELIFDLYQKYNS
jgi:hypothetical protein